MALRPGEAAAPGTDPKLESRIERALGEATEILFLAEARTTEPELALKFRQVREKFPELKFVYPKPEEDFSGCRPEKTLAYTSREVNEIYICRLLIEDRTIRTGALAQILIHEGLHKIGIHDECEATRVEVAAMRAARYRVHYKNGYWEQCGIHLARLGF